MIEPIAFLILSALPGQNRLKNVKYFMGQGDNIIGTDPRSHILLPQKYDMPKYIGNIRIGYNFITVQAFHPYLFYLEANLHRSPRDKTNDHFFPLQINSQYVPKMGEFFYIGRIKAYISTASPEEFALMKNITNSSLFRTNSAHHSHSTRPLAILQEILPQPIIHEQEEGRRLAEEKKEQVGIIDDQLAQMRMQQNAQQQLKSNTEVLDQENYQYEATLVLDDLFPNVQQTIPFEAIDYQQREAPNHHQHKNKYSQQNLLKEIRKEHTPSHSQQQQQEEEEEEEDFSMPDTIKDEAEDKIKPMFQLIESKSEVNPPNEEEQEDFDMPDTIKEDPPDIYNRIAQTSHQQKKKSEPRLYKSDFIPKDLNLSQPSKQPQEIEDFEDLFGDKQIMVVSALNHHKSDIAKHEKPKGLRQIISLKEKSAEKVSIVSPNSLNINADMEKDQKEKNEDLSGKKVHIVGFRPTETHRSHLKKKNLELVSNPDADYQILLVKQPVKLSNRLLLALIAQKRIESEQWIFNKSFYITSTINNIPWKQIYEKRGTQTQLLKSKGLFYISKRLEELLSGVVQAMGGSLVSELVEKRKVINVILRVEQSGDTQIYLKNRDNKKWRFLKSEVIVEAILLGKYSVQQRHKIKLFEDE